MLKLALLLVAAISVWMMSSIRQDDQAAPRGPAPDTSLAANAASKARWAEQDKQERAQTVKITKWSWRKGGFDSVMLATFTLQNTNTFGVKDIKIRCEHSAPSGTVIDSNTQTVYEAMKPGATRTLKDVNMGFVHTQAKSSSCTIADFTNT